MLNEKASKIFAALGALWLGGSLSPSARAAFQLTATSPRAAALGQASLPNDGDSTGLFLNPASLAGLRRGDVYFMQQQLYAGMEGVDSIGQGLISGAVPTRLGTFGLGLSLFKAAGLMDERVISFGYAKRLGRVELGVAGKSMHHGFKAADDPAAANDPVFRSGTSKSALSFDMGAAAWITPRLRAGVAWRNVNSPDVGLATEDRVPRELQTGLSFRMPQWDATVNADLTHRADGFGHLGNRFEPSAGLEKGVTYDGVRLALRVGAAPTTFSAGFGLTKGNLGFDYALLLRRNLIAGNYGTHSLGLRVRFGGTAAAREN